MDGGCRSAANVRVDFQLGWTTRQTEVPVHACQLLRSSGHCVHGLLINDRKCDIQCSYDLCGETIALHVDGMQSHLQLCCNAPRLLRRFWMSQPNDHTIVSCPRSYYARHVIPSAYRESRHDEETFCMLSVGSMYSNNWKCTCLWQPLTTIDSV